VVALVSLEFVAHSEVDRVHVYVRVVARWCVARL
jgi:hypothetical protein